MMYLVIHHQFEYTHGQSVRMQFWLILELPGLRKHDLYSSVRKPPFLSIV